MKETDLITPEELQIKAKESKQMFFPLRKCSFCKVTIGYIVSENYKRLQFDSSCGCTDLDGLDERTWDEMASVINMQSTKEIQQRVFDTLMGKIPPR